MTWIDLIVILFVGLSGVLAMSRGLIQEFLSLLALFVASVATLHLFFNYPQQLGWISPPWLETAIALTCVFAFLWVIFSLIAHRLSQRFEGNVIGPLDRSGGFLFGVLRGVFFITIPYIILVKFLDGPQNLPPSISDARTHSFVARSSEILLALIPSSQTPPVEVQSEPPQAEKEAEKEVKTAPKADADSGDGTGYKASDRKGLDQLLKSVD